jgi:hypothetical protein
MSALNESIVEDAAWSWFGKLSVADTMGSRGVAEIAENYQ